MRKKFEWMWNDAVVFWFKVLCLCLLRDWGKARKLSVRIFHFRIVIWSQNLLRMNQDCWPFCSDIRMKDILVYFSNWNVFPWDAWCGTVFQESVYALVRICKYCRRGGYWHGDRVAYRTGAFLILQTCPDEGDIQLQSVHLQCSKTI